MTVEELFTALLHCLGQINPLYAALALGLWVLFGDKLKALLGRIPLPRLPDAKPVGPPVPDDTPDPLDDWLENNPLLDRLWQRLKLRFTETVEDDVDEDELYLMLLKAIKEAK